MSEPILSIQNLQVNYGGIEAVKKQIENCKTYITECVVVELEARA